jgi:tetratricopeptide (TPR) repeat protein
MRLFIRWKWVYPIRHEHTRFVLYRAQQHWAPHFFASMKIQKVHRTDSDLMAKRYKKRKAIGDGVSAKIPATEAVAQGASSWLSRDWVWGLILVLAVILVYQPVWPAGFIWDDDLVVTANPVIIGPLGLKEIWTTTAADICPLTLTTFWVEHALWGLAPLPYHLVNILLQGACAVVLWRVLRSLQVPGAWLGAALWAVHPVEVESVAWVAEMKNTESGLFFLLSILFFVKWLKARGLNGRAGGGWNYALTLLFAALAMTSKSSTVILPFVLCLCAWWVEGRWQWRNLMRVAPVFLMSIAASVVSIWTQKLQGFTGGMDVRSWPERLATAGDAVWFYLGKLLWPHPLFMVYPRWEIDAGQWVSYLPLVVLIVVLILLWLKRESWSRPWLFALAYFLTALLPVLGLINISYFHYSFVADHFQYLAGMGPLALAGAGMVRLADFIIPERSCLQSTLGAGVLLILGIWSGQRAWVYESQETLWTDTLTKNKNCWGAYNGLGAALFEKGQVNEAIEQYQKALKINHNYVEAYNNLGNALKQKGQVDEAIVQYQKALEMDPNYAKAHYNLGNALFQKRRVDEAIEQFQKALEINPTIAEAHYDLGNAFYQKEEVDEAMFQYQKALEINPNYAEAHNNLGNALYQKGQMDEAIAHHQKALEINPNFADAHNNLGIALAKKGQLNEAIDQFQEALQIKSDYRDAQNNLVKVQAMARQAAGSK